LNLVVDIGNTRVKAALFNKSGFQQLNHYQTTGELLQHSSFIQQASHAVVGSVVQEQEAFYEALNKVVPTLLFSTHTQIPLKNLYQSASTLGSDRLAASVGAYRLYPNQHVLVVDAGTCIKYNFTNADNQYIGGAISPGLRMRFKALQHYTSRLPLVEPDFLFEELIGTNTQNSILSGVLNGALTEVEGTIDRYKQQFPGLICVLTGGDAEYLAKRLKNSIFAHPNLVLKGLNDILNYTLENN
jgi:type III pantothenate kinase